MPLPYRIKENITEIELFSHTNTKFTTVKISWCISLRFISCHGRIKLRERSAYSYIFICAVNHNVHSVSIQNMLGNHNSEHILNEAEDVLYSCYWRLQNALKKTELISFPAHLSTIIKVVLLSEFFHFWSFFKENN